MRKSALQLLQRLPGTLAPEVKGLRHLVSNNVIGGEVQSVVPFLHRKKQDHGAFNPKLCMSSMSFASQVPTVKTVHKDEPVAPKDVTSAEMIIARIPLALSALPPRSMASVQRSMASAAISDAQHAPYWVNHPYHILPPSPWPALAGFGAGVAALGMIAFFHSIPGGGALMLTGLLSTGLTSIAWWRDCIIESDMGMHTEVVKRNLIQGVWLFMASETSLFFGLLWACVHLGMSPNVNIQMQWPPVGIEAVGWDKRALVMSAVLAASYYSANVAMVAKDPKVVMGALATTFGLGVLFLGDQYLEYSTAPFNLTDGPYGSTFYMTTGFHGLHVFLGVCWLAACMAMYPRYNNPGVGMKGGILYWHFVDIVWIAVYGIIYVAQL
uniref:Cytochrome c oxidase subunit 3 n=2 Tax=Chlamydomonas euryale TaxID=1486919 RepID=A0A7R9YXB4_9CHLO|mmetsp:Transcript_31323/g.93512  ORF Transcript_31323/g.93512 Transcript_31323/m.93512 type:complete len:382 (+) Transcript_31323:162-1307(+)